MKKILHSTLALQALFCVVLACQGQTPTLYSVTVSNDHPLLYWNFDAGSGNAVQQMPLVNQPNNDLVPMNGATRVTHATLGDGLRLGNAAAFSGNNQFVVSAATSGRTTLANAFAIELWARSTATNLQTYWVTFGGNAAALIYDYNPNTLELFAGAGGRTGANGPVITNNDWHHIVFVYYGDGSEGVANRTDAYFDGALLQDIGAGMYCHPRLNSIITVGSADANGTGGFTGSIDEVAFYDLGSLADESAVTAKVSAMVTNHIAAAKASSGPSYASLVLADQPLLYWNFDEASGNALQQAPITLPPPDNTQNDLVPAANAAYISHAATSSGLQLGNAADLDGQSYFGELNGLDAGLASIPGPWAIELWLQLREPQAGRYLLNMGPLSDNYNEPAIIYGYNGPTLEVFGIGGRSGTNGVPIADQNWHHLLVVNYNTAPVSSTPGPDVNKVDFYIDNVLYPNVGGGFNRKVAFNGWLIFGAATDTAAGGFSGRLDELAIYDLRAYTNAADLTAKAAALAGSHYAAAFGGTSVGTITITTQPAGATGSLGQAVTFTVSASVTGTTSPLTYQWQRNGVSINGATNASYTTPPLSLYDLGTNAYRARVSAGPAFKFSNPAALVVVTPPQAPATTYSQRVLQDKPLLYWNFDEMTGPALQQAALTSFPVTTQNDLVPVGNVQWANHSDLNDGLSKLGKALQLDGYSYLFAPSLWLGRPSLNGPWAAEVWMQFQGQNGVAVNEYIANVAGNNTPALIYGYNVDRLELFNNTGGRSGTNGPTVADNNWHHVLWVNYDTAPGSFNPGTNVNRVEVYIDGTVKTNAGGGFNQVVSLTSLIFGAAQNTATPGGFTGDLDEFAIYDLSALSAAQIQTKAQNMATNHYAVAHSTSGLSYSATVLADAPLLYWNFDDANTNALQRAPVTLPPITNTYNSLVPAGAGRVQHSVLKDNLYLGNAADFNGVDYYRVAQFDVGRPTSLQAPWALEFWMQSEGLNTSTYLMNFGNNQPAAIYNYLTDYPQTLELFGGGGRTGFGGPIVTDQAWHHVFWVFYGDGTVGVADEADVYVDGTLIPGVRANFSQPIDILDSLIVGQAIPGYNGWLGRVDELAVYDLSSLGAQDAIAARVGQMVTNHLTAASSAPVVPPTMTLGVAGGKLTLTWSGSGFVLQQNNNLGNSTGWTNAPGGDTSPVIITIPATGDMFYRLKQ